MKKVYFLKTLVVLIALLTGSAAVKAQSNTELLQMIAGQMQSELPLDFGNGMVATAFNYDPEYNVLSSQYSIPEGMYDILERRIATNESVAEESAKTIIKMFDNMGLPSDLNCSLRITYGTPDGRSVTLRIDEADMIRLRDQIAAGDVGTASFLDQIDNDLAMMRSMVPMAVDEHTTLTNVGVVRGNVVFIYEVSDFMASAMRQDPEGSSALIKANSIPTLKAMYSVHADEMFANNTYVIYSYYDKAGNELTTVLITPRDLFGR